MATHTAVRALRGLQCTFAGGFAPVRIVTIAGFAPPERPKEVAWTDIDVAYPADGNMAQTFDYQRERIDEQLRAQGHTSDAECTHLALRLEGSTDGFGRVIIYKLDIETS